jgi:hypothetical protein
MSIIEKRQRIAFDHADIFQVGNLHFPGYQFDRSDSTSIATRHPCPPIKRAAGNVKYPLPQPIFSLESSLPNIVG